MDDFEHQLEMLASYGEVVDAITFVTYKDGQTGWTVKDFVQQPQLLLDELTEVCEFLAVSMKKRSKLH